MNTATPGEENLPFRLEPIIEALQKEQLEIDEILSATTVLIALVLSIAHTNLDTLASRLEELQGLLAEIDEQLNKNIL